MPPRSTLQKALRCKGYRFKRQADHAEIWAKNGHYPHIPRRDEIPDEAMSNILRQVGYSPEEVRAIVAGGDPEAVLNTSASGALPEADLKSTTAPTTDPTR